LKVTSPVGLKPSETCAVSFRAAPTVALAGFGVVAIVGEALPTSTASLAQELEAVLLLPSPL